MTGRERVQAAIEMGVADRPPVGAWGHTYREEWSPAALAAITVERARQFGWDFVKFQPRASSFAEAFGSVYKPAGHRLKGPVLVSPAVPDLESWRNVRVVSPKALDDQVESIGIVVRELGSDVPVIQTVFSPITVAGYLVGKSQARVVRELRTGSLRLWWISAAAQSRRALRESSTRSPATRAEASCLRACIASWSCRTT